MSFFSNKQTKFLNETSLGRIKPRRVLSLSRAFQKADLFKEEESIPLREDEDALVGVVFVTFVLPQFLFFLAPFREEEEEEEENKFGGR